jgi:hypothetical protein
VLIKAADDNGQAIATLTALLDRKDLREATRRDVEREIRTIRAGAKGERDAAYEIEFHYGQSADVMTIHDLRIEANGRVAQMDHLIINRFFDIWLCESKAYADGVAINEYGEWSAYYGRSQRGIPSPIEQNNRHVEVLREIFSKRAVDLPKRFGLPLEPRVKSIVLISNRGRITRPKAWARVPGIDTVVKAEQLYATINKSIDSKTIADFLTVVGRETVEKLARNLAALHSPKAFDWLARFGLSEGDVSIHASPATAAAEPPQSLQSPTAVPDAVPVCASCLKPVTAKVADYCRTNSTRFGGRLLCFDCQRSAGRNKPRASDRLT